MGSEGMEHLVSFNEKPENVLYFPRLNKLIVGISRVGLLFLYDIHKKFKSSFIELKFSEMVHVNADVEPGENTKSLEMIHLYGFYEYILCTTSKNMMVALDPDS